MLPWPFARRRGDKANQNSVDLARVRGNRRAGPRRAAGRREASWLVHRRLQDRAAAPWHSVPLARPESEWLAESRTRRPGTAPAGVGLAHGNTQLRAPR